MKKIFHATKNIINRRSLSDGGLMPDNDENDWMMV